MDLKFDHSPTVDILVVHLVVQWSSWKEKSGGWWILWFGTDICTDDSDTIKVYLNACAL